MKHRILDATQYYYPTEFNRNCHDDERKEFGVKFCPECKRAWEYGRTYKQSNKFNLYYYDDFPTYGLVREVCKNCK